MDFISAKHEKGILMTRFMTVTLTILISVSTVFATDRAEKEAVRQQAIQDAMEAYASQERDGGQAIDTIVPIEDASILVVVNNPIASWSVEQALLDVFNATEHEVAYWNVQFDGVFDTDLLQNDWDAVLLFADNTGEFPTREYDGGAWSQYLIDGGNLFYSDQDYFWANDEDDEPVFAAGDFAYDAFGIASGVNDSTPMNLYFEGETDDPISGDFVDDGFWVNQQLTSWWEDFAYPVNPDDAIFFNIDAQDESGHMHENMFGGTVIYTAFNCAAAAELVENSWTMTDQFTILIENVLDYFSVPQLAELELVPMNTTIPAAGGTVVYDGHFMNNTAQSYPGVAYWTRVTLPNGQQTGTLTMHNFTVTPFMDVWVTGLSQNVPATAPQGAYTFTGNIGFFPTAILTDSFTFTKE